MAYTYFPVAVLGAGQTAQAIGYRILGPTGTVVTSFTTTGVTETSVLGTYYVSGGIAFADDSRGFIEWGTSGTKYAVEEINPQNHEYADAKTSSRLAPTTAARTLDVSATGEAGLDWANVGSPTTVVGLSGTTIKTATDLAALVGTPAGASVSADIAEVEGETDAIIATLATIAPPAGAFAVAVTITDSVSTLPLQFARVTVKNSANTTILDQKSTSASGLATFALDAATYKVSVQATAHSGLAAQTLVVTANASQGYALAPVSSTTPTAPNTCVVSCFVYAPDGTPDEGVPVQAQPLDSLAGIDGAVLRGQTLADTTDSNGLAQLQLIQHAAFTRGGGAYRIWWSNGDGTLTTMTVTIPTASTANLEDLL